MPLPTALTTEVSLNGTHVALRLGGMLDENATLPEINDLSMSDLSVDLEGITHINSAGVRRWISWIWKIEKIHRQAKISLSKCQTVMVRQMMLVREFLPDAVLIDSMFIPYFCPKCRSVASELVDRSKVLRDGVVQEQLLADRQLACPTCATQMELDIDPNVPLLFTRK